MTYVIHVRRPCCPVKVPGGTNSGLQLRKQVEDFDGYAANSTAANTKYHSHINVGDEVPVQAFPLARRGFCVGFKSP